MFCVLIAFFGVTLIVSPVFGKVESDALFALASGLGAGLAYIFVIRLEWSEYLIPVTVGAMTLTILFDVQIGFMAITSIAILIGLMISKGVVPGPFLFVDETNLISLIFGGLIITNLFLLSIGFFATNLFAKVTSISKKRLGCFVMILIIIGTKIIYF